MPWGSVARRAVMSRVQLPFTLQEISCKSTLSVSRTPLTCFSNTRSLTVFGNCTCSRMWNLHCCRSFSANKGSFNHGRTRIAQTNRTTVVYVISLAVAVVGFSYAAVPLYRLYCQATGLGGTAKTVEAGEKIEQMERKPERVLKIRFNADTSSSMQWQFKPQQSEVRVVPGETALAFYTATNPTEKAITGISTYNVIPFDAGQYFNKIQCFCFEEQRLNPHEQVDMPVFFYIDPDFTEDPAMAKVDTITLSYTFFEAKEAEKLGI